MSQELSQRSSGARPVADSPVPHHLLCNSCSLPLFNGFQTAHGCRLCQACVTNLLHANDRRPCPGNTEACRDQQEEIEVSQATCFPDMATRRDVSRLRVLCPNWNAGCTQQLTWAQVDAHMDSCHFLTVACHLCNMQMMKKELQHHVTNECEQRKVTCNLCSQLVTFTDMQSKHKNLQSDVCCSAFSHHCPHCGDVSSRKMDRRGYVSHLLECGESPVACKYSHVGCSVRVSRSHIEDHYRTCCDSHLQLFEAKLRQVTAVAATSQNTVGESLQAADAHPYSHGFSSDRSRVGVSILSLILLSNYAETEASPTRGNNRSTVLTGPVQLFPWQYSVAADFPVSMISRPQHWVASFAGHEGKVTVACYLKDIRKIATGGVDGSILLWDVTSQNPLLRMKPSGQWGSVTCMASIEGALLVAWEQLHGILRLGTVQLDQRIIQGPDTLDLSDTSPSMLRSRAPVSRISVVPRAAEVLIALSDGSLWLAGASGDLMPVQGSREDASRGPVDFLSAPEPGRLLMRRLNDCGVATVQLRFALPGQATASGYQVFHLADMPQGRATPMCAWATQGDQGQAAVAYGTGSRGCVSIAEIDGRGGVTPLLSGFECHSSDVTAFCPLAAAAAGDLRFLATAAEDGDVRVWRSETRGGKIGLSEVSVHRHPCTVATLLLLAHDGGLVLWVGDAEGKSMCLTLQYILHEC